MSSSANLYIGAYAIVEAAPIARTAKRWTCPTHRRITSSKFCPECGRAIELITVVEERPASLYALLRESEFEDILFSPHEVEGLGENQFVACSNTWAIGQLDDSGVTEITPAMIAQCLSDFKEHYARILSVLAQRSLHMEIKFGVIYYVE